MHKPKPIHWDSLHCMHRIEDFPAIAFLKAQEATLCNLRTIGARLGWRGRRTDGRTHYLAVNDVPLTLLNNGALQAEDDCYTKQAITPGSLVLGDRVEFDFYGQRLKARVLRVWSQGFGVRLEIEGTNVRVPQSYDKLISGNAVQLLPPEGVPLAGRDRRREREREAI